jgi:hypothetical protein
MDSKNDSDEAQSWPEEDQGYVSVLPAARAKKQPQKPRDIPKELKARMA